MGPLDSAAKAILRERPTDLVSLAPSLAGRVILAAKADDTVLPASSITMDKILLVSVEDEETPLSLHVEVEANWSASVPRRILRYWSLAHQEHDALWSLVICLKPGNKQGEPRGVYERSIQGRPTIRFAFDVVKVWEIEASGLLADAKPGLLPLIPFARGATESLVDRALAALEAVEPEHQRGELQSALVAFAENVFPDVDWAARMPMELLMGSTIYQRGEVSGQRKVLARWLSNRLGLRAPSFVTRLELAEESILDQITDLLAAQISDDSLLTQLERLLPTAPAD